MRLKEFVYIYIVFTVSLLVFIPAVDAWSWKTHSDIVDVVYYGLPVDVQQKLDLNIMRDGSNDPDEKFHDFTYHSYPKSYDKAEYWLNQGKTDYNNGNYKNASYDYGVAAHYISDTFSAPHGVSGESSSDHSKYEDHGKKLTPVATYNSSDLNSMMQDGKNQDALSWSNWVQNQDDSIIQNDLNRGTSATLSAIKNSINSTNNDYNGNKESQSLIGYIWSAIKNLF
jgi:hypothetical protein